MLKVGYWESDITNQNYLLNSLHKYLWDIPQLKCLTSTFKYQKGTYNAKSSLGSRLDRTVWSVSTVTLKWRKHKSLPAILRPTQHDVGVHYAILNWYNHHSCKMSVNVHFCVTQCLRKTWINFTTNTSKKTYLVFLTKKLYFNSVCYRLLFLFNAVKAYTHIEIWNSGRREPIQLYLKSQAAKKQLLSSDTKIGLYCIL